MNIISEEKGTDALNSWYQRACSLPIFSHGHPVSDCYIANSGGMPATLANDVNDLQLLNHLFAEII